MRGSPDEPWIQSSGPTPTFASHLGATFAKVGEGSRRIADLRIAPRL